MIKKSIIIILTLLVVLTMVGCSSKSQQEEIDALKSQVAKLEKENQKPVVTAEPTPEIPQYVKEGSRGNSLYCTITSDYTREGLIELTKKIGRGYSSVQYYLPDAPKKDYGGGTYLSKKNILPDEDYCIASYLNNKGNWEKLK